MSAYQTHSYESASPDEKHLNLLSICQLVAGGLLALFGCCPLIYLVIGVVLVAGVVPVEEKSATPRYNQAPGMVERNASPSSQQNLGSMPPEYRTPPLGQSAQTTGNSSSERNAQVAAGTVFIVIAVIMTAVIWAIAIAILIAGVNLRKRKSYTYCMVVGAIECIFMPLGTILGVFTLIVLARPSVKALFENPSASVTATGPVTESDRSEIKQWP